MTEHEMREIFREMRDEPVPPDSQRRVRLAVAARTQGWRERLRTHWKIGAAILAPACVVLIAMLTREPQRKVMPPIAIETSPEIAAIQSPEPPTAPPPHRAARIVRHTVTARNRDEGSTVIRIETPDPDVVILLVGG